MSLMMLTSLELTEKICISVRTCWASIELTKTMNFAFESKTTYSATKTGGYDELNLAKYSFVRRSCQHPSNGPDTTQSN